jgi:plasmid stabilization system protein ParE
MRFRIEFTDVADMEVEETFLWMLTRSPDQADQWQEGLEDAVDKLADFPRSGPLAPENDAFAIEVRQLLYGKYRVLYTLVDTDDDGEEDTLRVLHVRHGARRYLHEADS